MNTANAIVTRDGNGDFAARAMTFEFLRTSLSQASTRTVLLNQNDVPFLRAGADNMFLGENAGESATVAAENVGIGDAALRSLTAGTRNTAVGAAAAASITTGLRNTAVGTLALSSLTTQNGNTAVGNSALTVLSAGAGNIAVGDGAGAALLSGSNNIYIGNAGVTVEDQRIRIGTDGTHVATHIAGIRGTTTNAADAVPVLISSQGQLGTISSSARVKHDIADLEALSSRIHELHPVSFRYLPSIDPGQTLMYGLIAEEVEEVMPELVARDADGQIETVKYHLLAPLLLAEVQRLRRELDASATDVGELRASLEAARAREARLESTIVGLEAIIAELKTGHAAAIAGLEARLDAVVAGLRGGGTVGGLAHAAAGNDGAAH
ncbi:MAG TPA: tail fiber domain-containing protein [Longimicrobiales bacterium]|nr:tail fiber domain-containing protein [Longimicrobiales bacterium]